MLQTQMQDPSPALLERVAAFTRLLCVGGVAVKAPISIGLHQLLNVSALRAPCFAYDDSWSASDGGSECWQIPAPLKTQLQGG